MLHLHIREGPAGEIRVQLQTAPASAQCPEDRGLLTCHVIEAWSHQSQRFQVEEEKKKIARVQF